MSKANFFVDPDFPVIDGVGHSDKQSFVNVKGGGSSNTTMFDPLVPGSHLNWGWFTEAVVPPWGLGGTVPSACDPTLVQLAPGAASANPGCLNAITQGDSVYQRCSDKVLLERVSVNGVVTRPGGVMWDYDGVNTVATLGNYYDPKCFIALVVDLSPNGVAFNSDHVFDPSRGAPTGGYGIPWLDHDWMQKYHVLAHDILDFADCPPFAVPLVNQFLFDGVSYERTISFTNYVWRPVAKGFRFDVDLNGALCSFRSSNGNYTDLVDFGLHVVAIWFNGYYDAAPTLLGFEELKLSYMYRLWFKDFLSPQSFAPAGADGPVVNDEAPDLDVLADQSAIMAGDAPEPRRKKTKASEGFFNFRPRSGPALEAFPDDFEFARLKSAKRSKSRSSRGQKFRRTDEPGEFFDDEAEPPYRRGKY